jgi:hypothetical protein
MKDYFNLSAEERIALAKQKDFVPEYFSKTEDSTTTTTTINPQ